MGVSIRWYSRVWDIWQDSIQGIIQTQNQGEVERRGEDDIIRKRACAILALVWEEICHIGIWRWPHNLFGTLQAT